MITSFDLKLNADSPSPLYRQLYLKLREMILSGTLPAETRLPSSRKLAELCGVARVTVDTAFEQLRAEGFVVSRVGAGTYVTSAMPSSSENLTRPTSAYEPELSNWGERVMRASREMQSTNITGRPPIDFGFGRSFPHIFPYDIWRRLLARYLSTDDTMLSRYGSAAGFEPLREAVSDYLGRLRGVNCMSDQVIIVSGMQQALDILSRLVLTRDDEIHVESPGYTGAFDLFRTFGVKLNPLSVDEHGFPVENIPADSKARFAFVTPSNQFPRGGTMPLARRISLLQWARQANALIFEDDYDGELRYSSHPLGALQGLDADGRVIYLGTFSKVLFPALRLGYVVLPTNLRTPFLRAIQLIDRGAPTLTQAAVTDFIKEGHFERHLSRLRKEYGQRRQVLIEAIERYLPNLVQYSRAEAGLHVMLYLPESFDEKTVVHNASALGVGVYPGAPYHLEQSPPPSILLGFSGLSQTEIKEGVARLAKTLVAH